MVLGKNRVNQVKWYQFIQNQVKSVLVKDFLFHSTREVRNGNLLKSRVSEIRVKRIRVNQGVGVLFYQVLLLCNKIDRFFMVIILQ